MKNKIKVLFVCVSNSFRSQIAETFLNDLYPDDFDVESAGLTEKPINPYAIQVMKEIKKDISLNKTKSVFDLYNKGNFYSFVITVCSREADERCPVFPGIVERINWNLPDPDGFSGINEEKLEQSRILRDEIKSRVVAFATEVLQSLD